ncbi:TusE/DsrC/DsvC family sulfur relay protein [Pyrobaculum sp. 3827-6]|uniref:TusE/DsrC/DsvC family sulfur relay protein n=1 Tax=Pyrobaculum sp. 3827-6 TaxID=2983604 RepID=UPI0021DACF2E|nr:TusE/DsrC/DsvC family sulfur relay protein [Pyrobaculum sp. 3827-6]MCU7786998.1 TusE/DsrC/DsvC family sulfur relay protein [Pyrobaculum sp. 3827-6]
MKCPEAVVLGGKRIELARCLPKNQSDWSIELAKVLAEINGIKITEAAVSVLKYVRQFWEQHGICPPVSVIESELGMGKTELLAMFGGRYDAICILAGVEPPAGCLSQVLSSI